MTAHTYILKDRKPVKADAVTWSLWFGSHLDERIVARWEFGEVEVSTVFLGVDHGHTEEGSPILFETMVFGGPDGGRQWRYATWEEAEKGHMEVCAEERKRAEMTS
jgi:hypothetical protein